MTIVNTTLTLTGALCWLVLASRLIARAMPASRLRWWLHARRAVRRAKR